MPLASLPLGENSAFHVFKCPKLCKVWISTASLRSINAHKIQSVVPFVHCHCILSQNFCLDLHDSCFKKFIAEEVFACKKTPAFHNIGLTLLGIRLIIIQYTPHMVSKPSIILQNICQLPDLLKSSGLQNFFLCKNLDKCSVGSISIDKIYSIIPVFHCHSTSVTNLVLVSMILVSRNR